MSGGVGLVFHLVQKFPDVSDGGLHLPDAPDGLRQFETPLTFAAREEVSLAEAKEWLPEGTEEVCHDVACELGSCVGAPF